MKVGDIIQFPTLEELLHRRTVQSQSLRFSRQCSEQELAKSLEGKTIVAGEIVNGIQMFRIKRD